MVKEPGNGLNVAGVFVLLPQGVINVDVDDSGSPNPFRFGREGVAA